MTPAPVCGCKGPQRLNGAASSSAQWGKLDARRLPEPMCQFDGGGRLRLRPAAVAGVASELLFDFGRRKRLLGAAAHVRLALFDAAAIGEDDADMALSLIHI